MIIDAHHHFWRYDAARYGWIGQGMEALMHDALPPDLQPLLTAAAVEATILVQARSDMEETEWLLTLAGQTPFVKGVVGWADPRHPQLFEQLERLAPHSKLVGLRYELQDLPDDFMLQPDFVNGLEMLHDYDLTFDFLIRPRHLPAACQVARRYPRQRFVVDHMAKPLIKQRIIEPWAHDLRKLAELPNVFCKLSGMVTEADWQTWQPADLDPFIDVVFEAFGPARLMFGSDWPVCTLAAPYGRVLSIVSDYIRRCSRAEQKLIMAENARQVYYYYHPTS